MRLVLASHNIGKLRELAAKLNPHNIELISLANYTREQPEETGKTFIENAIIKARFACQVTQLPALADDSGLVVDALLGKPGIYSSHYAGERADDAANRQKLLAELDTTADAERTACFYCALVLMRHPDDPMPLISEGIWPGKIAFSEKGSNGFGYDSLFYVPACGCVAAELSLEQKNRLSHRGRALDKLLEKMHRDRLEF